MRVTKKWVAAAARQRLLLRHCRQCLRYRCRRRTAWTRPSGFSRGNASTFNDTNGDGLGEFEGWGTSLCWWANRIGYSDALTSQAAELFFSDEGLDMNIGRYNVGGGDATGEVQKVPVNENRQFYDLTNWGTNPTGAGSSMSVDTYTKSRISHICFRCRFRTDQRRGSWQFPEDRMDQQADDEVGIRG